MTTLTNEKLTKKTEDNVEHNIANNTELDKAVYQAERAVLEKMISFDNLKSATEEEIDRQIIRDEIDPVVKAEDRLTTAVHLKLLPEFISYYLITNKTKIKQAALKRIFRLLFSSFIAGGKNSLETILPVLEIVDSEENLTPKILKSIDQELNNKILIWLHQELFITGENPVTTMTTLKKIVDDLDIQDGINENRESSSAPIKKITLIKLIQQCQLLTNEAKIRLIERIDIYSYTEVNQLGKLLAAEIFFGKSHKNLIIREVLHILGELEENIVNR